MPLPLRSTAEGLQLQPKQLSPLDPELDWSLEQGRLEDSKSRFEPICEILADIQGPSMNSRPLPMDGFCQGCNAPCVSLSALR